MVARTIVLHPIGLAVAGAALALFALGSSRGEIKTEAISTPAVLADPDGNKLELTQLLGDRPVLLAFMAIHCAPCESSLPSLTALASKYAEAYDLSVVCIYLVEANGMEHVIAETGEQPELRLYRDTKVAGRYSAATLFDVMGTPTFFLVGRDGSIQWKYTGELSPEVLREEVDRGLHASLSANTNP